MGATAVTHCTPHASDPAGSQLEGDHCGSCLDIELQFPPLKSRIRPLRVPVESLSFLLAISPASAARAPVLLRFSPGQNEPGPLLAQLQLRTIVLLN